MTQDGSFTTDVHARIGAGLQGFGGILRCTVCGIERPLVRVGVALKVGWPEHCGYTMRWVTQRQLDEEAARV